MNKTPQQWMEERKARLIANYDSMGLRASGNWPTSLHSVVKSGEGTIKLTMKGANYTEYMANGRRANLNQSDEAIMQWAKWATKNIFEQWVKDKNLKLSPFGVAYAIAERGIIVPNEHNDGKLLEGVITKDTIDELLRIVWGDIINDLKTDLWQSPFHRPI